MKKLTIEIFIQIICLQHVCGRPSLDERIERVFDITKGDRVNIDLAERVGVAHLAVSYPQGINCTLMKTVIEELFRLCRNVSIPVCKTVQKVRMTNVTEDCSQQAEYCQYNFRTQEVTQQTIICQRPTEMICDDSCSQECKVSCERNPIVVCNTVPQTVAITEKKQRCGVEKSLQTTKICFTYPDASWVCKEPRETLDCDKEGVRLVAHEVAMPRIECQEKEMEPLCIPENCLLKNSNTDCLTTDIPTEVKLEDQVCEICQEGRTKLRPVVVQEEECDTSSIQEFCSEGVEDSSKWTKTCSVPSSLRDEVLQRVLENTRDEFNEIPDVENREQNDKIQESKIIRMKLPLQIHRQGTESSSAIEGADIFFAKQFFQNDLVRRGKGDNEVLVHTNQIESQNKKTEGLVDVPFVIAKGTEIPNMPMKVNFKFDAPTSPPRPTGVPYVYSDTANIPFTKRPTPSDSERFNTRFGQRPTPQMVTEPSSTINNDRAADTVKKTQEKFLPDNGDIDSIIDLISDTDFNLALPLPSNIQPSNTFNLLNPRVETLNNQNRNHEESPTVSNPRFPFLEWQDDGSGFPTQSLNSEDVRNLKIRERFNIFQASQNDQILPNKEFYGQNLDTKHLGGSDVGPFSKTKATSSNTIGITKQSDSHPNELHGLSNKPLVNVNNNSEVQDPPLDQSDPFSSNESRYSTNFDSSLDQTNILFAAQDTGGHSQATLTNNSFQNSISLKNKETGAIGGKVNHTNSETSDSNGFVSSKGTDDDEINDHQSSTFNPTQRKQEPELFAAGSRFSPGNREPVKDNLSKLPQDVRDIGFPQSNIQEDESVSQQPGIDFSVQNQGTSASKANINDESELVDVLRTGTNKNLGEKIKLYDNLEGVKSEFDTVLTDHENLIGVVETPKSSDEIDRNKNQLSDQKVDTNQQQDETDKSVGQTSLESEVQVKENLISTEKPLRGISPRKLDIVGSDDKLEPIIQGRIHENEQVNEESDKKPKAKDEILEAGDGMCSGIKNEKDRIRCKVIACFRDNNYCF